MEELWAVRCVRGILYTDLVHRAQLGLVLVLVLDVGVPKCGRMEGRRFARRIAPPELPIAHRIPSYSPAKISSRLR